MSGKLFSACEPPPDGFKEDTERPHITFNSLSQDDSFLTGETEVPGQTVYIEIEATDDQPSDTGVEFMRVTIFNSSYDIVFEEELEDSSAPESLECSGTFTTTIAGEYQLEVEVLDAFDNSRSKAVGFVFVN